jgi:hypothetical protein
MNIFSFLFYLFKDKKQKIKSSYRNENLKMIDILSIIDKEFSEEYINEIKIYESNFINKSIEMCEIEFSYFTQKMSIYISPSRYGGNYIIFVGINYQFFNKKDSFKNAFKKALLNLKRDIYI